MLSTCKLPYLFFNVMFIVLASYHSSFCFSLLFSSFHSVLLQPLSTVIGMCHSFQVSLGPGCQGRLCPRRGLSWGHPFHTDVMFAVILEVSESVSAISKMSARETSHR